MGRLLIAGVFAVYAMYVPTCIPPSVRPTVAPGQTRLAELWQEPVELSSRDVLNGPWGPERAPDPQATYRFLESKRGGANPGMTVRDQAGRTWRVKQPSTDGRGAEGPIEVVLSRVLSAIGYHQPPVYYVASFLVDDGSRVRRVPGGRFRLAEPSLRSVGDWSWQQNPFVGARPYQGLLVILLMFNSSDLKNSNNTIYEYRPSPDHAERWYVVRDLGTALGGTGRVTPVRGNADMFERLGFIRGIEHGFVEFEYHGWHQELVRGRIAPGDVRWASELLAGLTETQWREAFLAGGFEPAASERFIRRLQSKIRFGRALGEGLGGPES